MEEEPKEFQKQVNPIEIPDTAPQSADNSALVRTFPTRNGAILLFLLGLAPFCLAFVPAPAILFVFLHPPIARLVFIGTLVWHGFGCYLFARTRGRIPMHALYRIVIVLFFTIPFILFTGLGPPAGSNFPAPQNTWEGSIYNGWRYIWDAK